MTSYCPVANDTIRRLQALDAHAYYETALADRQSEILEHLDDLDDLLMTHQERLRLVLNLRALTQGTPKSQDLAIAEIREIFVESSRRAAEHQLDEERRQSAEDRACQRYEVAA